MYSYRKGLFTRKMTDFSKEELLAFTEANIKTALVLDKIVNKLEDVVSKQDKILDKFSNGWKKEMLSDVENSFSSHIKTCQGIENNIVDIKTDIRFTKQLLGIIGVVIIIVSVILRFLGNYETSSNYRKTSNIIQQEIKGIEDRVRGYETSHTIR